jgi:sec-independent protein translocase protein TatA
MIGDILQPTHLLILLIVVLLVLGPKRLPSAGRALGQSLKEFKGSLTGESNDQDKGVTS